MFGITGHELTTLRDTKPGTIKWSGLVRGIKKTETKRVDKNINWSYRIQAPEWQEKLILHGNHI